MGAGAGPSACRATLTFSDLPLLRARLRLPQIPPLLDYCAMAGSRSATGLRFWKQRRGERTDVAYPMYRRRISPNERLYMAGDALVPPLAIQLVFEGRGELSFERLCQAVAAAVDGCPPARVHASGRDWVASPVRIGARPPSVHRGHLPDDVEVHEWSGARRPLEPAKGRGLEVWLLRGGSRVRLVLRVHHAWMDGRGVLLFAERVFAELRNEAWAAESSHVVDVDMPGRDPRTAGQRRPSLSLDCASPLGVARADDRDFVWLSHTSDVAPPAAIARLATALSAFAQRREVRGPMRFMVPVDLRRHLPRTETGEEPLHSGNLSLPLFLEVESTATWRTVQQTLLQKLQAHEELSLDGTESVVSRVPFAVLQRGTGALERVQRATGRYLASGILSHLGRVSLARFVCDDFEATGLSALTVHVPLAPVTITAVEVEGPRGVSLQLSMSCPRRAMGEGRAFLTEWSRSLAAGRSQQPSHVQGPEAYAPLDPNWAANATQVNMPRDATVGQLFVEAAVQHADRVALVQGTRKLSYGAFLRACEAVAERLTASGVVPGDVVAVAGGRTMETVTGLLGTLLVGAAYLPIDPSYPVSRMAQMMSDAHCVHMLVDPAHRDALASVAAQTAVTPMVLRDAMSAQGPSTGSHRNRAKPADLAYVLYTSGSTGRPKGVEITHENLVHYVTWATERYEVNERSVFSWFTSVAFDLSGTSIFLPLLAGGRLALHDGEISPALLFEAAQGGATHVKLTPSHLQALAQLRVPAPAVRALIVGGEQLLAQTAEAVLPLCDPSCLVFNEYGPTEATIGCVVATYARDEVDGGVVPIGLPVPGTRAVVVTEAGTYAQGLEPGELWIGGEGLSCGYRNAPELTAERFVERDGQRWYRTGDVVQRLSHGALGFRGRMDDQVKVRGHRVELGEVERTLTGHESVTSAVVQLFRVGDRSVLGAHVTVSAQITPEELLGHLRARVPEYMVPAFAEVVSNLPLTPNGKVDRARLRPPETFTSTDRQPATATHVPEVPGVPAGVVSAWCAVLGAISGEPRVDLDFFAQGGDSVALLELLARIEAVMVMPGWARGFPMVDFLATPTLGHLGSLCLEAAPDAGATEARHS